MVFLHLPATGHLTVTEEAAVSPKLAHKILAPQDLNRYSIKRIPWSINFEKHWVKQFSLAKNTIC